MESYLNYFIKNIYLLLNPNSDEIQQRKLNRIFKVHIDKQKHNGDISFSLNAKVWQSYLGNGHDVLEFLSKLTDTGGAESFLRNLFVTANCQQLVYPVQTLNIKNERCMIFLNRCACISKILKQVLGNTCDQPYGMLKKRSDRKIRLSEDKTLRQLQDRTNLSIYRAVLISQVLRRILSYSEWEEIVEEVDNNEVLNLQVVSNVETITKTENLILIRCGIVCDSTSGKIAQLRTDEYLKLRTADMRLMAMHKYGIRAKADQSFCTLLDRLGVAAAAVDLLEVKHSSPVKITRNGQGSTKGASFILYNSARLETLLRKFEDRIATATYDKPPSIDDIDFEILCEEEEWQLCFGYILQFPQLIERCVEDIDKGLCAIHLIVRYISAFVGVFSVYYRRIRILTQETRQHLMPFVYARIYLIKGVREVLNSTLALLDIEPVAFM